MSRPGTSRGPLLGAVAITAISVAAIWIAQGTENLCPAIYPAPASCSVDARTTPALVGTVLVIGLLAVTLVLAWRPGAARVAVGVLAAVGAVVPWWVFTSAGFIVDGTAMALLLCSAASVVIGVTSARRIRPGASTSTPVTP